MDAGELPRHSHLNRGLFRGTSVFVIQYNLVATTVVLILEVGQCTGEDLARIVGPWSWAFLARRSAFSIFNDAYRFIEVAGKKRIDIWLTLARELTIAADLSIVL